MMPKRLLKRSFKLDDFWAALTLRWRLDARSCCRLPDAGNRVEYRLQFREGQRPLENSHAGPFETAAAAIHYYKTTMRNQGCTSIPTVVREKIEWEVVTDIPDNTLL